jgi:hypothetical protein
VPTLSTWAYAQVEASHEPNGGLATKPLQFWLISSGVTRRILHVSGLMYKLLEHRCVFSGDRLHHFQLEVEFLAAKDCRQVELPKLPREAKRWPALIEVHDELES